VDIRTAETVFIRWAQGEPVYEATLVKAAEALGADPQETLAQARFETVRGHALSRGRLSDPERGYFAQKLAQSDPERARLAQNPKVLLSTLEKLAGPPPGLLQGELPPQPGATLQQVPSPASGGEVQAGPQEWAQILQELEAAQQQGQTEPPPPPPPPTEEQRIRSVAPDLDAETLDRYTQALSAFEQQIGIPLTQPEQLQKFLAQVQKQEGKYIDQQIKAMGAGAEQAQPGSQPTAPPASPASPLQKIASPMQQALSRLVKTGGTFCLKSKVPLRAPTNIRGAKKSQIAEKMWGHLFGEPMNAGTTVAEKLHKLAAEKRAKEMHNSPE
jgi:hypothetical protein